MAALRDGPPGELWTFAARGSPGRLPPHLRKPYRPRVIPAQKPEHVFGHRFAATAFPLSSLGNNSARHEMQANFYASVLMAQGFSRVRCSFVCVEVPAESVAGAEPAPGEPFVARYEFDAARPPRI